MDEGLFYSETALLNSVLFFSEFNDINIFVEDEYKEYVYENIFERMLSEVKVNKIFPMKGKKGVEKAFKEYGEEYDNKPAIYIVDGDFDVILSKKTIQHINFIYLEKYNIESYYIEEKAVLKFMAGKMKQSQKKIAGQINYAAWEIKTYEALKELFMNYLIAQYKFPAEKNVGISPHSYFYENGDVNLDRINQYKDSLQQRIENYQEIYDSFLYRFNTVLSGDSSRLICGKYLLASLSKYLRNLTNTTFKEADFVYYLMTVFNIKNLDFIKERILIIMKK